MKLLFVFAIIFPVSVSANRCLSQVIFLAQDHENDMRDRSISQKAMISQFMIASYLKNHPNHIVFLEGNYEDRNYRWLQHPLTAGYQKSWKMMFPEGLPSDFWSLSDDQKIKLADGDGAAFSFVMGWVRELRKTAPDGDLENKYMAQAKEYFKAHPAEDLMSVPVDSYWHRIAFERRERLALNEISEYFKNRSSQKSVVLVFGSAHNFYQHSDLFPPECISIPPEFQSSFLKNHPIPPIPQSKFSTIVR